MKFDKRIVYSINVTDIQEVAQEEIGRRLTRAEVKTVEDGLGGYIDWYQAIANTINLEIKLKPSA